MAGRLFTTEPPEKHNLSSVIVLSKAKMPLWFCLTAAASGEQILPNYEWCLRRIRAVGPVLLWEERWMRTQTEDK